MVTKDSDPFIGRAPLTNEGFYTDGNGYLRRRSNKKLVHRERYYQEYPETRIGWQVHHINGEKKDNRLENLIALRPWVHKKLHETFKMWELPSRREIRRWIVTGKTRRKRKKKIKKQKNNTRKRMFSEEPSFPKLAIPKKFINRVIVRKKDGSTKVSWGDEWLDRRWERFK